MKPKKASRTAQYMALFRAIETRQHRDLRLFKDEFATLFLDATLRAAVKISAVPWIGKVVPMIIDSKGPGAFTSGVARTRYIDDLLSLTVKEGVAQIIILGAGFDTRAMRLPFLKNLSVIEIDHPDTSNFKIARLKKEFGGLPENVRFIQIDFNKESIGEVARRENLDLKIQTAILWEGVSNYVSDSAVSDTFNFVSTFAEDSYFIFTYIDKLVLEKPHLFFGTERIRKTLNESQEQWTFGFNPSSLPGYIESFHLNLVEDNGAESYRKKYMPERDLVKGYEFYRVAFARVETQSI